MKTRVLITIGVISGIIILVTLTAFVVPMVEANHQKDCIYDGGKVTGFLKCTITRMDYASDSPTVFINLGATDPENKNSVYPKEMTVVLGENSTVTWINTDGQQHFINSENWTIGPLNQGERQSITFNRTGVYEYFSADSPSILGSIIVKPERVSEINIHCMTLEQSKDIAPFFKVPSYLPEGYSMKCSRSAMPSESYIIYHNKDISDKWVGNIPMLIDEGAIFILQTDEKTLVGEKEFATFGSTEQRIQETYDEVMVKNPSLNPQLIRINGILAYAVDSCPDCGVQTADFPDGTSIQKSTSTETTIKFIDENGINYMLKTTLSLDELILVAESLK